MVEKGFQEPVLSGILRPEAMPLLKKKQERVGETGTDHCKYIGSAKALPLLSVKPETRQIPKQRYTNCMLTVENQLLKQANGQDPLVSIVLPVYNCENYVSEAIQSILNQTYEKLELIIIDDGSNDNSAAIISSFNDPRIILLRQSNQGLASALNRGIHVARGRYIARQDQDDISSPRRLAQQMTFMESNPKCVLLGSWAQIMEGDRLVQRFHRHPVDDLTLRYQLLFNNPFVHSSIVMRRAALVQVGYYTTNPERQPPEDYELWSRISRVGSIANLGEILVTYREVQGSMSRTIHSTLKKNLIMLSAENIASAAGLCSDDKCIRAITTHIHGEPSQNQEPPDFARMREILKDAINSLGNGKELKPLHQDALYRVNAMRAGWLLRKTAAHPLLYQNKPLRLIVRRLWSLAKILRKVR